MQLHVFDVSLVTYVGLAYLAHAMHLVCTLYRGTPGDPSMSVPRAVRLMKTIHQGLLLWLADSFCSHGTRCPWM